MLEERVANILHDEKIPQNKWIFIRKEERVTNAHNRHTLECCSTYARIPHSYDVFFAPASEWAARHVEEEHFLQYFFLASSREKWLEAAFPWL